MNNKIEKFIDMYLRIMYYTYISLMLLFLVLLPIILAYVFGLWWLLLFLVMFPAFVSGVTVFFEEL